MKRIIKLNESKFAKLITESVNQVLTEFGRKTYTNAVRKKYEKYLTEDKQRYKIMYRGYNSKYGSQKSHCLWLTDDISYARAYGNRVEEIIIDPSKLKCQSVYGIDELLGYEFDYYQGPDKKESEILKANNCNSYEFYVNSDDSLVICLWDLTPIITRRELSKEEFEEIEEYEGFDNYSYDDEY